MARPQDPVEAAQSLYYDNKGLIDENHRQKLLTLDSSKRHIILSYPQDLTDDELLEFIGYLTHEFRRQLPPRIAGIMAPVPRG